MVASLYWDVLESVTGIKFTGEKFGYSVFGSAGLGVFKKCSY